MGTSWAYAGTEAIAAQQQQVEQTMAIAAQHQQVEQAMATQMQPVRDVRLLMEEAEEQVGATTLFFDQPYIAGAITSFDQDLLPPSPPEPPYLPPSPPFPPPGAPDHLVGCDGVRGLSGHRQRKGEARIIYVAKYSTATGTDNIEQSTCGAHRTVSCTAYSIILIFSVSLISTVLYKII